MPVQSNQCHKDPQRWRDNPPFQKPSQHNECNRKQWQIVVTPMAISQKVGKGQFLPKVGRAVLYIYIFWAKHTAKLLNSIQLPAPNCSGGQLQRRNLQTMYREHRIQSNTSNLVEPLMGISRWGTYYPKIDHVCHLHFQVLKKKYLEPSHVNIRIILHVQIHRCSLPKFIYFLGFVSGCCWTYKFHPHSALRTRALLYRGISGGGLKRVSRPRDWQINWNLYIRPLESLCKEHPRAGWLNTWENGTAKVGDSKPSYVLSK